MSRPTVREDGWRESVDRNSHSGNSHLREERREDSGLCAIIDCQETRRRKGAEVELDIVIPNGMHIRKRQYFHEGREKMTVIFKAAAYIENLIRAIGKDTKEYVLREFTNQYP